MTLNFFYLLFIIILYIFNKGETNIFFIKLLIISFLTNDLLRITEFDFVKNYLLFFYKDFALILLTLCSIYYYPLKRKFNIDKYIVYFLIFFTSTILFSHNFDMTKKNILIILSGIYEFIFYPFMIILLLTTFRVDINKFEKFFLSLNIFLFFILIIQIIDPNIYLRYFLNLDPTNKLYFDLKTLLFQGKWTSNESDNLIIVPSIIFSNPGRYGHYILTNFLICLFLCIRKKNYINFLSIFISTILVFYSSQRASIYLSIFSFFMIFSSKENISYFVKEINSNKRIIVIFICFILLSITFVKKYNEVIYIQATNKIYNTFEPLVLSFNKKHRDGPESFSGRVLMSLNGVNDIYLNDNISLKQTLFGHGYGIHSLGTKTILKKIYSEEYKYRENFFYEQKLATLLYDSGINGLLLYFCFFVYLYFKVKKRIKKFPYIVKRYFFVIIAIPIILLHTGYQFYGDYIFQFFYYFLIGMILNYSKDFKKN